MLSQYRSTTSLVYLLFCLFTASAFARSVIRQFPDGFNTNLHNENEAGAIPNLEEAHYLHKHQEITSRDYKASASNIEQGLSDRSPSTFSLKMESYSTLSGYPYERYETLPFSVGGYNWTLIVYPNGNQEDSSGAYVSLYVAIDKSTFNVSHQEVYADVRFYIFNHKENKYFMIQDTNLWQFNVSKTMWGFSRAISTFNFAGYGYISEEGTCEYGIDLAVQARPKMSERFSVAKNFEPPTFTWTNPGFSTLIEDVYLSDVFTFGERSWRIQLFPRGIGSEEGKSLSMFLMLNTNETLIPYEKIYVIAKLRVLNQRNLKDVERPIRNWFDGPGNGRGYYDLISLSHLNDPSKGFVVDDVLKVQVEMLAVSSSESTSLV